MAVRRPLVLVAGVPAELPAGDTLPGGGGGGPTYGTATLDFGSTPTDTASVVVSVPGMTAASVVEIFPMIDSTASNDADQHRIAAASLRCSALPATDQFTIEAHAIFGLATGEFKQRYAYQ